MANKRFVLSAIVVLFTAAASWAVDSDAVARARGRVNKGEAALQKGEFESAEKHFRKAIEFSPEVPSAHLGLGAALVGQKSYGEALEALAEAERRYHEYDLMLQESGTTAVNAIENTQKQVDTLTETYGVFQRAPSLQQFSTQQVSDLNISDGSSAPANLYYLQGVASLRTGQKIAGIERLERCLEINGSHGLAHHNLAVALYTIERYQEAGHHLQMAMDAGVEPPPGLVAELETRTRDRALADASTPSKDVQRR